MAVEDGHYTCAAVCLRVQNTAVDIADWIELTNFASMKKHLFVSGLVAVAAMPSGAVGDKALDALMERISPGLSQKIVVGLQPDSVDRFVIDAVNGRPRVTASDRVSAAAGLNWYLKYMVNAPVTWSCPHPAIPEVLPLPAEKVERSTRQHLRYYLNYCTHSYSMPFWGAARWQQEIDWMALHGINAALAVTGTDAVWDATLRRLGYPEEKIDSFIASPAYQAWWLMNNLEGEGAPMTRSQLEKQRNLQQGIVKAMRELDIESVLPGYTGMLPHDAATTLGLPVADPGKWCGYSRPSFLLPTDSAFSRVAEIYYDEQSRMYGTAKYYSMDPFHEGGDVTDVNLAAAAKAIEQAMERNAPGAVWLIQGWQANPRPEILEAIKPERMTVLDLHSETVPQWSARGHHGHPWVWCMLLNFGGNEGLHGKFDYVARAFEAARQSEAPPSGLGLTMEGIENNEMMFELATELPWNKGLTDTRRWLHDYARARYGGSSAAIDSAWTLLADGIYGAGEKCRQQGTTESPFCARPSDNPVNVSTWANSEPYYNGESVIRAAKLFASAANRFGDNPNYRYDLVDITRQAVAEAGRREARQFTRAAAEGDKELYAASARNFMRLLLQQDSLLATLGHFRLGRWIGEARRAAADSANADSMERDARRLVTTWGGRQPADEGGLHDYAHREWQGLLRDFYGARWKRWFAERLALWDSGKKPEIDFFGELEEPWTEQTGGYSELPEGDPVERAQKILDDL